MKFIQQNRNIIMRNKLIYNRFNNQNYNFYNIKKPTKN